MNNTIKSTVTAIVASILVVVASFTFYHPTVTVSQPAQTPVRGTSPEFSSPYLIINGVTEWYFSEPMRTGTTTLCSFPAPSASSTIQYVSFRVFGNSGITANVDIGTSTVSTGTSTNLLLSAFSAATSTGSGFIPSSFKNSTINSTQFLNVVADNGAASTTGTCQAEFTSF